MSPSKTNWQKTLEQCLWNLRGKEYEQRMSRKSVSGMKMPRNPTHRFWGEKKQTT